MYPYKGCRGGIYSDGRGVNGDCVGGGKRENEDGGEAKGGQKETRRE